MDRREISGRERRNFPVQEFRVRRNAGGEPMIEGHAAVFNQPTEMHGFTEEVAPRAFRDSIQTDDIRALFNHNPNYVLGRNRAGTLTLREDSLGLFISNRPPDVTWARDLLVSIERGDISQMSFGFQTLADEWTARGGMPHRTLKRVKLLDVSPVTFPAYEQTDVSVALRSLESAQVAGRIAGTVSHPAMDMPAAAAQRRMMDLVALKHGFPSSKTQEAQADARERELELRAKREGLFFDGYRDLARAAEARRRWLDSKR